MTKRSCDYRVDADIELAQTGIDQFTVRYFKQIKSGLTYSQAAREYGCCLMHWLACEGKLDNRERRVTRKQWLG
jgi:hypothetical protein